MEPRCLLPAYRGDWAERRVGCLNGYAMGTGAYPDVARKKPEGVPQSHTAIHTNAARSGNVLQYAITYKGIPSRLVPLAQLVRWRVKRRMEVKLMQIARRCCQGNALVKPASKSASHNEGR